MTPTNNFFRLNDLCQKIILVLYVHVIYKKKEIKGSAKEEPDFQRIVPENLSST